VGNSGMFRPEMLLPMGLPEDVNVIAWGLSLERYYFYSPPYLVVDVPIHYLFYFV
jgi:tRNA synthetases class II core domain (F)